MSSPGHDHGQQAQSVANQGSLLKPLAFRGLECLLDLITHTACVADH